MTISQLIERLVTFNPEARVVICTTFEKDNVQMWEIDEVHDGWFPGGDVKNKGKLVSLQTDLSLSELRHL